MTLTEQRFQTDGPTDPPTAGPDADMVFARLVQSLRSLGDRALIGRALVFEQRLERERLIAAARVAGSSGDVSSDRKRTRGLLGGPQRSRRSTNRDARRAAAVAANPSLESKVANGSIAPDSLDALTKAAEPDTGQIPGDLIDEVAVYYFELSASLYGAAGGSNQEVGRSAITEITASATCSGLRPSVSICVNRR